MPPDRVAVIIQAQLRAVGVEMEIGSLQPGAGVRRVAAGEFAAILAGMTNSGHWFGGGGMDFFGPHSPSGYVNPRAVALLERAQATVNPDEIDRAYRELAPIFQADLPVGFLSPRVETTVAHRRLRGLSSPYRTSPVWHMDELWLEPSAP